MVVKLGIPQIKHIQIVRNVQFTGGFVLEHIPDGIRTKCTYGDGCVSLDQPGQLFGGISGIDITYLRCGKIHFLQRRADHPILLILVVKIVRIGEDQQRVCLFFDGAEQMGQGMFHIDRNGVGKGQRFVGSHNDHGNAGGHDIRDLRHHIRGYQPDQAAHNAVTQHADGGGVVRLLQIQTQHQHVIALGFQLFLAHFDDGHIIRRGQVRGDEADQIAFLILQPLGQQVGGVIQLPDGLIDLLSRRILHFLSAGQYVRHRRNGYTGTLCDVFDGYTHDIPPDGQWQQIRLPVNKCYKRSSVFVLLLFVYPVSFRCR